VGRGGRDEWALGFVPWRLCMSSSERQLSEATLTLDGTGGDAMGLSSDGQWETELAWAL
jgi:hypothetical protein